MTIACRGNGQPTIIFFDFYKSTKVKTEKYPKYGIDIEECFELFACLNQPAKQHNERL